MLNWDDMKNKRKPLGKRSPWVWAVELVRGCNLSCWHCTARTFPYKRPRFMSKSVWESMFEVVSEITPRCRLELGQCGEPTLHPDLLEYVRTAKSMSPTTQLLMHTNGVMLLNGKVKLGELFNAGFHTIVIDVYKSMNKYMDMARASGAEWYKYDRPRDTGGKKHRQAFTYYNDPDMKLIVLRDCPERRLRWRKMGKLSTFLNHIDWEVAMPYGLVPVRESYERRCTIPMRFSTVDYEGNYLFCCIDFWSETAGLMGNVKDGVDGFKKYWFGRLMQSIRRRLKTGDRKNVPYCSRCNCAFSKCDWIKLWPEGSFDSWWDGAEWSDLPSPDDDSEVFAPGWKLAEEQRLPAKESEDECLRKSKKLIIPSTVSADSKKKVGLLKDLDLG